MILHFFQASDLQIELNKHLKPKPDSNKLVFGKNFTDHMLTVEWSKENGWGKPHIKPFQNLSLHPASSALHYSVEVMVSHLKIYFAGKGSYVRT